MAGKTVRDSPNPVDWLGAQPKSIGRPIDCVGSIDCMRLWPDVRPSTARAIRCHAASVRVAMISDETFQRFLLLTARQSEWLFVLTIGGKRQISN